MLLELIVGSCRLREDEPLGIVDREEKGMYATASVSCTSMKAKVKTVPKGYGMREWICHAIDA